MNEDNKKQALDSAIAKIAKDYGKGSIMRFGDESAWGVVETIPTGAPLKLMW